MPEADDIKLLGNFAASGSEEAFRTLVERYVNLVYSVALRHTGNPHHAQEITQAVFIILARKSRSLRRGTILSGWLYQTARLTAANFLRTEIRRVRREQEAHMQSLVNEPQTDDAWQQIAPLLDDALGRLGEKDRNAVVLRFFDGKSLSEVGTAMGASEDAAKMRVNRALEKLRKIFGKRGATLTTALLAAAVSTYSVQAAPVGLAAAVAATKGSTAAASVVALTKATLKAMAWLKVKFALGVSAAAVATSAVVAFVALNTNEPPSNPALARQMLQAAFAKVSAPLPERMRFVAEVERVKKPWTEAQIRQEVERQDEFVRKNEEAALNPRGERLGTREERLAKMSKAAQDQWRKQQAELQEIRTETVRWAHGTRTYVEQEWLSGGQWRLDQLETTTKPDRLQAMEGPLPAGMAFEKTMISVGDPRTVGRPPEFIDHRHRAAWFNNSNWKKEAFWEAATLEPPLAFLLTMALSDLDNTVQLLKTRPTIGQNLDSFAGVKLDTNKLDALAAGRDSRWTVRTEETVLNGRRLAVLRLKGKTFSFAHGVEVAFFADPDKVTNIYRIELTGLPLMKTPYVSIRDDFDTNGFPHTWIVETPKEETLKRTVKFKQVEIPAQFDDQTAFSPEIPVGYSTNGRPTN